MSNPADTTRNADAPGDGSPPPAGLVPPVTLRTLRRMAERDEPFACLTCYDATTARLLERAGVHVLLVGDTAAEVILGFARTIDMPLEVLIALTAGVKRGAPGTVVMADMPFMSYQADEAEGIRNAARFITEGLADVVKIEADHTHAPMIERMTRAGIPVCGHVGSRPQRSAMTGGYTAAGRTREDADAIIRDAVALEKAGCVLLLVEAVPREVARRLLDAVGLPVIGIGAGPECHGQVLVLQDAFGMTDRPPPFAVPVANLAEVMVAAGREWVRRVTARESGERPHAMKSDGGEPFARHERRSAPEIRVAHGRGAAGPAA